MHHGTGENNRINMLRLQKCIVTNRLKALLRLHFKLVTAKASHNHVVLLPGLLNIETVVYI